MGLPQNIYIYIWSIYHGKNPIVRNRWMRTRGSPMTQNHIAIRINPSTHSLTMDHDLVTSLRPQPRWRRNSALRQSPLSTWAPRDGEASLLFWDRGPFCGGNSKEIGGEISSTEL